MPEDHPLIVVMGVSGSGKSTIGERIAGILDIEFIDADDLHPITNVDKMAAGHPLTDHDRAPWLEKVGAALGKRTDTGAVIACSALKLSYRDQIRAHAPGVRFVLLSGSRELLTRRLGHREHHFMPAELLDSQFAALEPLGPLERGVEVDIDADPDAIARDAVGRLAGS